MTWRVQKGFKKALTLPPLASLFRVAPSLHHQSRPLVGLVYWVQHCWVGRECGTYHLFSQSPAVSIVPTNRNNMAPLASLYRLASSLILEYPAALHDLSQPGSAFWSESCNTRKSWSPKLNCGSFRNSAKADFLNPKQSSLFHAKYLHFSAPPICWISILSATLLGRLVPPQDLANCWLETLFPHVVATIGMR